MVHVWAIQHTACTHFYGHTHTWKAQFFEYLSHPFWLSSQESCCLRRLIFKLPSGSEFDFIWQMKMKRNNIHFPLCLSPKWCSEPGLLLFPLFWQRWAIFTLPSFILFLTPMIWWRGQTTQLSIFCPQAVGKNYLILEVCPLPSCIPSLHRH